MIGVPVLNTNDRDFGSYYVNTVVLHESSERVCRVREVVDDNRVLCEYHDGSDSGVGTFLRSELSVVFPEVFYSKRGALVGVNASRSYKRAPYDINCSMFEFWERIYGSEPCTQRRIGWSYYVKQEPLRDVMTNVLYYMGLPVGIVRDNLIYVDGIHRERLSIILSRIGGRYELAELSGASDS